MKHLRAAIGIALLVVPQLPAQPAPNPPAFEVASVKLSDPTKGVAGALVYPGGRVYLGHRSLVALLQDAFRFQEFQISATGWMRDEEYDIDARPPAASQSAHATPAFRQAPMNNEQREMLLTLLADRFQLKFHRESKEGAVLFLMRGNRPSKLEPAKDKTAFPWVGSATDGGIMTGTGIRGVNAPMTLLAERLMWFFQRPVLDRTGLQDRFDFRYELTWQGPPITSSSQLRSPDVLSSLITSVDALGLQLKPGKAPIEMIVVDHAQKPSAN